MESTGEQQYQQRIAALEAELQRLQAVEAEVQQLKATVLHLQQELARAQKNSSNSSKPPSSDIVKPPRPPGTKRGKRRIGGQVGHPHHPRPPLPPQAPRHIVDHRLDRCPVCGRFLRPAQPPRIRLQMEIPAIPAQVHEHRFHAHWCQGCQQVRQTPSRRRSARPPASARGCVP